MAPSWPKMVPRWPQDGPKLAQDGPRWSQDGSKLAQDRPKLTPRGPKGVPRWSEGGAKLARYGPKRAPRGPRGFPEGPKTAQEGVMLGHLEVIIFSSALPVPMLGQVFISVSVPGGSKNGALVEAKHSLREKVVLPSKRHARFHIVERF